MTRREKRRRHVIGAKRSAALWASAEAETSRASGNDEFWITAERTGDLDARERLRRHPRDAGTEVGGSVPEFP